METNMNCCICATWEHVEDYLKTIPGDSSIVIEEMSSLAVHPKYKWMKTMEVNSSGEFWDSLASAKDVYSVQWIPGTEVHKFNLPSDGKYDLYYKFEDGEFADIGTPALQRTETMVSHLE